MRQESIFEWPLNENTFDLVKLEKINIQVSDSRESKDLKKFTHNYLSVGTFSTDFYDIKIEVNNYVYIFTITLKKYDTSVSLNIDTLFTDKTNKKIPNKIYFDKTLFTEETSIQNKDLQIDLLTMNIENNQFEDILFSINTSSLFTLNNFKHDKLTVNSITLDTTDESTGKLVPQEVAYEIKEISKDSDKNILIKIRPLKFNIITRLYVELKYFDQILVLKFIDLIKTERVSLSDVINKVIISSNEFNSTNNIGLIPDEFYNYRIIFPKKYILANISKIKVNGDIFFIDDIFSISNSDFILNLEKDSDNKLFKLAFNPLNYNSSFELEFYITGYEDELKIPKSIFISTEDYSIDDLSNNFELISETSEDLLPRTCVFKYTMLDKKVLPRITSLSVDYYNEIEEKEDSRSIQKSFSNTDYSIDYSISGTEVLITSSLKKYNSFFGFNFTIELFSKRKTIEVKEDLNE